MYVIINQRSFKGVCDVVEQIQKIFLRSSTDPPRPFEIRAEQDGNKWEKAVLAARGQKKMER